MHIRNIFHTCRLLGLDQSGGSFEADDKAAGNLGVQSTTVASLFHIGETLNEDFLDPSHNFVRRRVRWLIQVDNTVFNIFFNWSLQGGMALGNWGVMVGLDIETVKILEDKVKAWAVSLP